MAKQLKIPIRCFFFTAPYELAKHNNAYRAWAKKNVPEAEVQRSGSALRHCAHSAYNSSPETRNPAGDSLSQFQEIVGGA